jgi:protein SCO1/2
MTPYSRPFSVLVWGLIGFVILVITTSFVWTQMERSRPPLPVIGQVPEFTLTNQLNQTIALKSLRGQIWVADVIFTRCPGPCMQMTRRMRELQDALRSRASVRLVSLTSDPQFDTPKVLRAYAQQAGADPARWHFLTGPDAEIRPLVIDGLKLVLLDKNPAERTSPEDLFIHSTLFAVIDKQGRLRATAESLETNAIAQIIADIRTLQREK